MNTLWKPCFGFREDWWGLGTKGWAFGRWGGLWGRLRGHWLFRRRFHRLGTMLRGWFYYLVRTMWAASGSAWKLNSACDVIFPIPREFPPINSSPARLGANSSSATMQAEKSTFLFIACSSSKAKTKTKTKTKGLVCSGKTAWQRNPSFIIV